MIDIIGQRYIFFAISALIIVAGIVVMAIFGLPLSIDFKSGSMLEAKFASGTAPEPAAVIDVYQQMGYPNAQVFTSGKDVLIIRSVLIKTEDQSKVLTTLSQKFNDQVTAQKFDNIGPALAEQVTSRGALAVVVSSIVLAIYISIVFRGVPHAFRYGVATVAALFHDVMVMLSVVSIAGHFWGWQFDTMFLTALLTVIAFSAQDTVVVFDRIRENAAIYRKLDFEKLVNHSVVQTLTRSINTQIMAVDLLLLALALLGGITLREFAVALLVGMFSGSYSSDCIAAPILVVWENQEWKTWFRGKKNAVQAA